MAKKNELYEESSIKNVTMTKEIRLLGYVARQVDIKPIKYVLPD